jgi:hypothetical protein
MANVFLKKLSKIPLLDSPALFFLGCQVARIRHTKKKKKKKKEKTLNYESKQNIAPKKKKKKNSGMELNWPLIKVKLAKVHMVNLVFWQKK